SRLQSSVTSHAAPGVTQPPPRQISWSRQQSPSESPQRVPPQGARHCYWMHSSLPAQQTSPQTVPWQTCASFPDIPSASSPAASEDTASDGVASEVSPSLSPASRAP